MLAEDLLVVDADTPLWLALRPLLDAALRLEQSDESYSWHGWNKAQIRAFLRGLSEHCTLLAGVWDTIIDEDTAQGRDILVLGCICEVKAGRVCSVRTFESLTASGLPALEQLEPGYEHAFELLQLTSQQVAPVAWALFTDKAAWDEWLFTAGIDESVCDKGELLAGLIRQGRCVLLDGSQPTHGHR